MNYYSRNIGDYMRKASHLTLLEHGVYMRLLDVYYTRESAIPHDQRYRLVSARTDEEREAVDLVLNEFFEQVGNEWVQYRCEDELAQYAAKSEKARVSANARWNKSGDAMPTESERNASAMHSQCGEDANAMQAQCERNASAIQAQCMEDANAMPTQCERNASAMLNKKQETINNSIPPPLKGSSPLSQPPESPSVKSNNKKPGSKQPTDEQFEAFKAAYPKRGGSQPWPDARRALGKVLAGCSDPDERLSMIVAGAERYAKFCQAVGKIGTELVMQASRFLNQREFENDWEIPPSDGDNGGSVNLRPQGPRPPRHVAEKKAIREALGL